MSATHFFRIQKIKGNAHLLMAARHNRRALQAELGAAGHIDPTRTAHNETLHGASTPDGIAKQAKALMLAAGITKLRKDAVTALEAVFSLPANLAIDRQAYFARCVAWVAEQFGGMGNILSADVHNDEAQPHMHVLILPLRGGRMVGSDMMGDRKVLLARQASFSDEVASLFGLNRAPARITGAAKKDGAARVLAVLRASNDYAHRSKVWQAIRAAIESDPAPFMSLLGIAPCGKPKRLRSSTAIFTSPGKGPKKEANPIGFKAEAKRRTLSCVGFTPDMGSAWEAPPAPAHQ